MTWHPISSAPRDGTIIDVWLGDATPDAVDFYCTPGTRRSPGWRWEAGKFRPVVGLTGRFVMPVFVQPTHWVPMPEPPE